jgi:hypothetical protein
MQPSAQNKTYFHTMINIGLTAFLILVATVGMRSLTYTGDFSTSNIGTDKSAHESVMICAIGQCVLL